MKKFLIKILFIFNTGLYWILLFKTARYVMENVIGEFFPQSIEILNYLLIIGIFVVLLPLAIYLTHCVFKFIRDNYDFKS